jgi:hypothetical protein
MIHVKHHLYTRLRAGVLSSILGLLVSPLCSYGEGSYWSGVPSGSMQDMISHTNSHLPLTPLDLNLTVMEQRLNRASLSTLPVHRTFLQFVDQFLTPATQHSDLSNEQQRRVFQVVTQGYLCQITKIQRILDSHLPLDHLDGRWNLNDSLTESVDNLAPLFLSALLYLRHHQTQKMGGEWIPNAKNPIRTSHLVTPRAHLFNAHMRHRIESFEALLDSQIRGDLFKGCDITRNRKGLMYSEGVFSLSKKERQHDTHIVENLFPDLTHSLPTLIAPSFLIPEDQEIYDLTLQIYALASLSTLAPVLGFASDGGNAFSATEVIMDTLIQSGIVPRGFQIHNTLLDNGISLVSAGTQLSPFVILVSTAKITRFMRKFYTMRTFLARIVKLSPKQLTTLWKRTTQTLKDKVNKRKETLKERVASGMRGANIDATAQRAKTKQETTRLSDALQKLAQKGIIRKPVSERVLARILNNIRTEAQTGDKKRLFGAIGKLEKTSNVNYLYARDRGNCVNAAFMQALMLTTGQMACPNPEFLDPQMSILPPHPTPKDLKNYKYSLEELLREPYPTPSKSIRLRSLGNEGIQSITDHLLRHLDHREMFTLAILGNTGSHRVAGFKWEDQIFIIHNQDWKGVFKSKDGIGDITDIIISNDIFRGVSSVEILANLWLLEGKIGDFDPIDLDAFGE